MGEVFTAFLSYAHYMPEQKKSTKKKKDIIFDVIQRKNGEENTTRIITR